METDTRSRMNKVFATLRKNGFIAKQNFSCCNENARDVITKYVKSSLKKSLNKRRMVFYTKQDGKQWDESYTKMHHVPGVWVSFGAIRASEQIACPSDKSVGSEVVLAFRMAGFRVDWTDINSTKVFVYT